MTTRRFLIVTCALALAGCSTSSSTAVDTPPEAPPVAGSGALTTAPSCDGLLARLQSNRRAEVRTQLAQWEYATRNGMVVMGASDYGWTAFSATYDVAVESGRPDTVKTDGSSLYVLDAGLVVFGIPAPGELVELARVPIEGAATGLLLAGDRVIVLSRLSDLLASNDPRIQYLHPATARGDGYYSTRLRSKVTVHDVADRSAPRAVRELYFEADIAAAWQQQEVSRLVLFSSLAVDGSTVVPRLPGTFGSMQPGPARDQVVRDVAAAALAADERLVAATSVGDFLPRALAREQDSRFSAVDLTSSNCGNVSHPDGGIARGLVSVVTLDATDGTILDSQQTATNLPAARFAADTLVLSSAAVDLWWYWTDTVDETSFVRRFDLSSPAVARYTGSGRVAGVVRDQSISGDAVRVVHVTGDKRPNRTAAETHVAVLAGASELDLVGQVDGLGVGEFARATLFVGDQVLVATSPSFGTTSVPGTLWTVDLSSPSPRLVGQDAVPSAPDVLVRLSDAHLFGVASFVADPAAVSPAVFPRLQSFALGADAPASVADSTDLEAAKTAERWSAGYARASVLTDAALDLVAVPLTAYRRDAASCTTSTPDGYLPDGGLDQSRASLELVRVDPATGALSLYGSLDQTDLFDLEPPPGVDCIAYGTPAIDHGFFVHGAGGDYVYAVSRYFVTAHRLEAGLPRTAALAVYRRP